MLLIEVIAGLSLFFVCNVLAFHVGWNMGARYQRSQPLSELDFTQLSREK